MLNTRCQKPWLTQRGARVDAAQRCGLGLLGAPLLGRKNNPTMGSSQDGPRNGIAMSATEWRQAGIGIAVWGVVCIWFWQWLDVPLPIAAAYALAAVLVIAMAAMVFLNILTAGLVATTKMSVTLKSIGAILLILLAVYGLAYWHGINDRQRNARLNPAIYPAFRAIEAACLAEPMTLTTKRCEIVLKRALTCSNTDAFCAADEYHEELSRLGFSLPSLYLDNDRRREQ